MQLEGERQRERRGCGHGCIQLLNWTGAAAVGRRRAQSAGDAVERNFNFMLSAKYSF